jgi:hypothetical protein
MQTDIKQNLAIAIQAKFNIPEFLILDTFTEQKRLEIEMSPNYEVKDGIAIQVSDIDIDQVFYIRDGEFHYPTLFINDRHLLSGRQGGILPSNLVTAFPGQIIKKNQLTALQRIIPDHSGYITISLSLIDGKLYFKDLLLGIIPDYIPHLQALHNEPDPAWFHHNLEDMKLEPQKGMSASCRLFTYPYGEGNRQIIEQFPDIDVILTGDCYITLKHSQKPHIKDLWIDLYKSLSDPYYVHNGLVFNPDGGIKARKVYNSIKKAHLL